MPPNLPITLYKRFFQGANLGVLVLPAAVAERYSPDVPHVIVSITNPFAPDYTTIDPLRAEDPRIGYVTGPLPQFPDNPLRRGVFRLLFHDADAVPAEEATGPTAIQLMTPKQAEDTWNFLDKHLDQIELLVVHCHAGLCRSPGLAAAVSLMVNATDQFFFDTFWPNRHVYRTMLEAPGAMRVRAKVMNSAAATD